MSTRSNNRSFPTYETNFQHNHVGCPDTKISTYLPSYLEAKLSRIFSYTSLLTINSSMVNQFVSISPRSYTVLINYHMQNLPCSHTTNHSSIYKPHTLLL